MLVCPSLGPYIALVGSSISNISASAGDFCIIVPVPLLGKGVFLAKMKNALVPIERVYSVNTYSWISLSHEEVSQMRDRARQQSKQAKQA